MILVAHRTPPSRAACAQLAGAGASMFEADVQVDGSGSVVVSHFVSFGAGGRVQRDNWRLRWHTAEARDLRLGELADLVPDGCDVLLDLKERAADRRAQLVAKLIDTPAADRPRFVVCGHPAEDVATLRAAGFRTWRSVGNPRHLAAVLADGALPDEAITIRHTLLSRARVDQLRERAPRVVAWTVNSARRAQLLRSLGVDGVTTDSIAVLRSLSVIPN